MKSIACVIAFATTAMLVAPAAAQTYSHAGALADYADIKNPESSASRDYAWGLRVICPKNREPVAVTCWIDELSDATLTTSGGQGRAAFCLWRFGPFTNGLGRNGRITAKCAPSSSVLPAQPATAF